MFDLRGFCLGMLTVMVLLALLFGTGIIEVSAEETSVMFYPTTPGAVFEERMSAVVEGDLIRLEYQKTTHPSKVHFMESSRIRFAADGPVNVELQLSCGEINTIHLRTVGKDLGFLQEGRRILFELPGPGHYYLQLPQLAKSRGTYTVLFWIDDLAKVKNSESYYGAPRGIIVTEEGVVSDPSKDQTARIQGLLDRGGVICFPEGTYRTDALRIGSDTTVYLAPGALLKANDDYHKKDKPSAYITIENAQNVLITGVGTIDANGLVAYDVINGETKIHNVNIIKSQGVRLADVLFRDSNSWAIHIMQSQGCNVDNVKIFSGKDGIDPDSSKDVTIENVFIQSYDDAIAVKTRFAEYPTENIIVRDSIVSSVKSALKIGTETRALVQNVRFESIDVFDGERGIVLYGSDWLMNKRKVYLGQAEQLDSCPKCNSRKLEPTI